MNVVSSLDSFDRGTYQKPLFLSTVSFKGLRSTQMRVEPDGFSTTTMAAHH